MRHWEFFKDPLYSLGDFKDDEGRPIGERNASPEGLKDVPLVLKECPYKDHRFKHEFPMNVSALKQINQHWDAVIDDVHTLRHEFLERYPAATDPPDMLHLWKLTRMICVLPAYLVREPQHQLGSGQVPAEIAALYKVVLGVYQTFDVILMQATIAGYNLDKQVTPALMLNLVEAQKLFVSPHGVCAGPTFMVEEILSVIIYGKENAQNASTRIKECIGSMDDFFDYYSHEALLHLSKYIYLVNSYNMAEEYFRKIGMLERASSSRNGATGKLLAELSALAEEYQPASKISPVLKQTSRQIRDRFLAALFKVINSFPHEQLQTEASRLLRASPEASSDEEIAFVQALLKTKHGDASVWEALVHPLAQYAAYERRALEAFTMLQSAVDVSLGYEASPETIESADLEKTFGHTLTTLTAETLGVSFKNYPHQTAVQYG